MIRGIVKVVKGKVWETQIKEMKVRGKQMIECSNTSRGILDKQLYRYTQVAQQIARMLVINYPNILKVYILDTEGYKKGAIKLGVLVSGDTRIPSNLLAAYMSEYLSNFGYTDKILRLMVLKETERGVSKLGKTQLIYSRS